MSCLTGLTVTEATLLPGPEEFEDPEAFLSLVTLTEAMVTGHWRASCEWQGQRRGKGYMGLTEAVRVSGTAAGRAQAERVMSVSLGSLLGVTRPTPQGRTQEKLQIIKTFNFIHTIKKVNKPSPDQDDLTTVSAFPPLGDAPGPGGPWSAALAVARVAGLTPDPGAGASSPWRPLPRPPLPSSFGKQLILKCFTITKITAGTLLRHSVLAVLAPHSVPPPALTCCFSRLFTENLPTLHIGVTSCYNVTQGLTLRPTRQGPVLISCKFHLLYPSHPGPHQGS